MLWLWYKTTFWYTDDTLKRQGENLQESNTKHEARGELFPQGKIEFPYFIQRKTKHQKVYYDTLGWDWEGNAGRVDTTAWLTFPSLPVIIGWRALDGVRDYKDSAAEDAEDDQAPGYPTKDLAGEDTQVEEQDWDFCVEQNSGVKYLCEIKLLFNIWALVFAGKTVGDRRGRRWLGYQKE
jgi:hypothetical protein